MTLQVTQAAIQEILRLHHQHRGTQNRTDNLGAEQSSSVLSSCGPLETVETQVDFVPGGCAEQRYQLSFDAVLPEGTAVSFGAVTLHISQAAWPHVQKLTLDYVEDLMGGSFRFDNPGLPQTCNCGQSFYLPSPIG